MPAAGMEALLEKLGGEAPSRLERMLKLIHIAQFDELKRLIETIKHLTASGPSLQQLDSAVTALATWWERYAVSVTATIQQEHSLLMVEQEYGMREGGGRLLDLHIHIENEKRLQGKTALVDDAFCKMLVPALATSHREPFQRIRLAPDTRRFGG